MNWWWRSTKKNCGFFSYNEHIIILVSAVTGCVSISAFASLGGISVGITSSAIGVKICCVITAGIKSNKEEKTWTNDIISKNEVKYCRSLNASKALIDANIS